VVFVGFAAKSDGGITEAGTGDNACTNFCNRRQQDTMCDDLVMRRHPSRNFQCILVLFFRALCT